MVEPPTRRTKLEEAVGSSERGEWAVALEALREAWLRGAHPRLTALARAAAERVRGSPVVGKRERDVEARWLELASTRDRSALTTLALMPWPRLPRDARARIEALAAMPCDVLVGAAFAELVRCDPYRSTQGAMAIRRALRVLFAWKDPMATVLLAELGDRYDFRLDAVRKLAPVPPVELDEHERGLVDELDLALASSADGAKLRGRLLAEVFASPSGDGPRAVLADALVEAGDPRGEFISLQLAHSRDRPSDKLSRRERELLRAHGVSWLGELGPFVRDEPARVAVAFSRGFVSRCWLKEGLDPAVFSRAEAWATVEELSLSRNLVFAHHENLRSLRSLERLSAATDVPIPPLESLTLYSSGSVGGLALTQVGTLGLISDFGLDRRRVDDTLASARRTRWFDSVTRLRLPGGVRELGWASAVLAGNPRLQWVELSFELVGEFGFACQWGARLGRDRTLKVSWEGRNWSGPPVEDLAFVLAKAPLNELAKVEVVEQAKLTKEQRAIVTTALEETLSARPSGLLVEVFGEALDSPSP